jgi:RNA polymerase sigma-70 factor (ECF subfamily)
MELDSNDSEHLLRRAAAGDEAALAPPRERHRTLLRRMARLRLDRRLQGRVDPPDVLQGADLDLGDDARDRPMLNYLRMPLVAGRRPARVHRQHLGVALRGAGREVALDRGALPRAGSASLAAQWLGRFTTASQTAGRAERQVPLQEALIGIDAMDCAILAPQHFEGPTRGESAPVLGLSKTAANNRSIRARGRLRDLLERVPGFFDEG